MIKWKDIPEDQRRDIGDHYDPPDNARRCQAATEFYSSRGFFHQCGGWKARGTRFCVSHGGKPTRLGIWQRKLKRIKTILKE